MMENQDKFLEELYHRYFRSLVIHAYCYLGNWEDSHVAAQDAFRIACEKIDALMSSENAVGWMKNTVKNLCYRMMRERNRQMLLFSSLDELTDDKLPIIDDDSGCQPTDILDGLISKEELALLKKIIVDGASYTEAAKELGCTVSTCRKRVQRSIDKIRQKYREKFGEDFYL